MTAECISRLLHRHKFPENERRPSYEQYSSWPEQAAYICRGHFDQLHILQTKLLGSPINPGKLMAIQGRPIRWTALNKAFLFVGLVCALLTALTFMQNQQCFLSKVAINPPPNPPPKPPPSQDEKQPPKSLVISTDQYFGYDSSTLTDSAKENLERNLKGGAIGDLLDTLNKRGDAKFTITGFTDPIGGICYNPKLADARANAIREILVAKKIVDSDRITVTTHQQGVQIPEVGAYKQITEDCINKFQKTEPTPDYKPLREFTPDERKDPSCKPDEHDWRPNYIFGTTCTPNQEGRPESVGACAAQYSNVRTGTPMEVAMVRAHNFRKIVECLSPLRRVQIDIRTGQ
jgi:hypothetical protein